MPAYRKGVGVITFVLLLMPAIFLGSVDGLEFQGSVTPAGVGHRMDCEVVGDRAYVSVATSSSGLEAFDISDPANPVQIFSGGPAAWRSQSYGDTLLVMYCRDDGVTLFDISGSSPTQIGQYNPPGPAELLEGGVLVGDTLYCAAHQNGIYLVDVSNPGSPLKVGEFAPDSVNAWNIAYRDSFLFVANGRFGLSVLDTQGGLQEVATLSLPGCANDLVIDGDVLAISLGIDGLATVDISDPCNPVLRDTAPSAGSVWSSGIAGHMVATGSWYVLELFDVSNPDAIERAGWDNTPVWALGADIRDDGLIGSAGWIPVLLYDTGADTGGDIDLEHQVLDFGPVFSSRDTSLAVRNTGAGSLTVTSITTPSGISVSPGSFILSPGDSIEVTVTASGSETTSGYITYHSDDPDEPGRTQEVYKNNFSFPQFGSLAPDFTLAGTDGLSHTLSDYQGKVVFLEFGGAW